MKVFQLINTSVERKLVSLYQLLLTEQQCCIRGGPDEERILDVVPKGTELVTLVTTGSRAGRTHSQ